MSRVIFCGNLPADIRQREVEDLFHKYGRIIEIDLKTPSRPPAFAFIEFDDPRDAIDAVRGRDNYDFGGSRLRVELAKGGSKRGGGSGGYGGGYGGGISRRSQWRVMVTGLPRHCSWQDLKDFMRKAGDVTYSNVYPDRDGMMGIVDFAFEEDMKYAIRKLDDSEFDRGIYVRVKPDSSGGKSPSRRDSRRDSRSPPRRSRDSRSPRRSRSRSRAPASRSRSRSPVKARSASRSRSPAKSASPARSD